MGIIAAGQITVVDLSDAPVLNAFITASRPTTQTYSKDSKNYNPSYASTPQVLTLNVTKAGSTTSIIDSISGLHWFVVDGSVKTEITSKVNTSNEYISGTYNENLTTKLNIDTNKSYRRYEATGVWRDPSTDLDVQFSANIDLLLTQNGATGPQGPQGDDGPQGPQGETGNGIANTVVTYGLSMTDTTEPATWSSERPALVKGMYLWTRTVIIYTNGESTTSYQISYIPKDGDATGEIDKTKQELLEKLETVRDDSLAAVEEAKQQLVTVRDESLAAAEEAKQQVTTVADDLSKAKTDFQNAVNAVDTKATNVQNDLSQAKQDLASQAQQLREQANAQSELTNRVSSVEETANGTKTTVNELTKTVAQNGKDITSVTARTKVVEDDLSGTKTTLSQVKTTADSTSQKTATLETGLNGLSAKFDNLKIGGHNYLRGTSDKYQTLTSDNYLLGTTGNGNMSFLDLLKPLKGETVTIRSYIKNDTDFPVRIQVWFTGGGVNGNPIQPHSEGWSVGTGKILENFTSCNVAFVQTGDGTNNGGTIQHKEDKLEKGNIATDYSPNEADLEQKVAEYKQNADQNYASLQSTVQNLDGTVQHNKTVADQTAQGFSTRIESLETYKDGESERANAYFESAKTETAKQLTAERTAIAKDYVAKSTYTSDVTGIRNDLTATTTTANTTKTNLANYQASNDKMVASLKSSLQTTDGNVSNLQTKVEAVPGQITSAVSAVEGKIPTTVGGRNYLHGTSDKYQTYTSSNYLLGFPSTNRDWNKLLDPLRGKTVTVRAYIKNDTNYPVRIQVWTNIGGVNGNTIAPHKEGWSVGTGKMSANWTSANVAFTQTGDNATGGTIKAKEAKLEVGNIPSDWSPAPEDAATQISSLSSQIKQTADGMTLLATKTELNKAKTELQSGINTATNKANNAQSTANSNAQTISTHTTQISALNTGLQAKVSQSEFNTLSGRVTTAENNITAKANELSSKITSVEGKIPTTVGGRNYIRNYGLTATGWTQSLSGWSFEIIKDSTAKSGQYLKATCTKADRNGFYKRLFDFSDGRFFGKQMTWSMDIKLSKAKSVKIGPEWGKAYLNINATTEWKRYSKTFTVATTTEYKEWIVYTNDNVWNVGDIVYIRDVQLEDGSIATSPVPAIEDTESDIKAVSSELKQTADGMTLLATKTELNTAKNELQSGIKTATDKANSNAQTISTHTTQISALNTGLNAKVSQSDFNTLSGRVTTAENNITAKANELSSKISSVEGKLPSGEINLVEYGRPANGYSPYAGAEYTTHGFYYNGSFRMYIIRNRATSEKTFSMNRFKVERNTEYTLYFKGFNNSAITNMDVWFLKRVNGSTKDYDSAQILVSARKLSNGAAENISVTFNTGNYDEGYLRFDNNGTTTAGEQADLYFGDVSVKKGKSNNGWSPSLAELASSQDLKNAQSEFKQTTDSIKASVQSLDNNTVKNSSLTINADGIVMKAGKSTTDVANAIGSYFAVNQNAINLFSDKIKVKGNMIVNGAITGDKIAANSISSSNIVSSGITANVIKGGVLQSLNGSTNFELDTGKLFYNNNNTGVFRVQNGASTMGLKFSNTSLTVNGTSRILSRAILGGDRRETSLDDGKWDKGGFSGVVIETIKGVDSNQNEKADAVCVVGDTISFTHTYSDDSLSARGWRMETYSPTSSYPGNVVLKPYGINYRSSNIIAGDLRLDNGDGSGYWMRATINTLKACFGHILNGGTSSQALNAIRSELNKISGI